VFEAQHVIPTSDHGPALGSGCLRIAVRLPALTASGAALALPRRRCGFRQALFGDQDRFNGLPVVIEVFENALHVSVCILNLIVSYRTPIVVKNVVPQCADILMRLLLSGLRYDAIVGSRIDAFLQIPQTGIVSFCISVRLQGLLKCRAEQSRSGTVHSPRLTFLSFTKFRSNVCWNFNWQNGSVDRDWVEVVQMSVIRTAVVRYRREPTPPAPRALAQNVEDPSVLPVARVMYALHDDRLFDLKTCDGFAGWACGRYAVIGAKSRLHRPPFKVSFSHLTARNLPQWDRAIAEMPLLALKPDAATASPS